MPSGWLLLGSYLNLHILGRRGRESERDNRRGLPSNEEYTCLKWRHQTPREPSSGSGTPPCTPFLQSHAIISNSLSVPLPLYFPPPGKFEKTFMRGALKKEEEGLGLSVGGGKGVERGKRGQVNRYKYRETYMWMCFLEELLRIGERGARGDWWGRGRQGATIYWRTASRRASMRRFLKSFMLSSWCRVRGLGSASTPEYHLWYKFVFIQTTRTAACMQAGGMQLL